jgi:DNA replication protein DnaC
MTDLLLQDPHIPSAFRGISYSDYHLNTFTRQRSFREVSNWRPTKEKPNLLLYGTPGLGKTFLAVASLNERQKLWEFRTKSGTAIPKESLAVLRQNHCPVYFIQLAELIDMHIKSFNLKDIDEEAWADLVNLLDGLTSRAKWLVVDDVGKEHSTSSGFSNDTFDLLVRSRFNNGLFTIFTSNLPPSQWAACYSESMRSFIQRSSQVVQF